MASVKTQVSEWYVDALTTTPVILRGTLGTDYMLIRRKIEGSTTRIRDLVAPETDDLSEYDVAGANKVGLGIVPDTVFNRRQLEKDNGADWSYALAFSAGTVIEIAIPIKDIVVSANLAASNAINPTVTLASAASGDVALAGVGEASIGKPLCIVTSGTGEQVIPMVLFGTQVPIADS